MTPHGEKACLFLRRPQRDRLEGRRGRFEFCRFNFQTARPSLRAKRSNPFFLCGFMDCFVASLLAMTAIPGTRSRSRGAMRPSCAFIFRPQGRRGECRVPAAPAVSCALGSGRTHTSNNEYTGTPGIPARNGFNGLCRALVSAKSARMWERAVLTNRPLLDLSPFVLEGL